MRAGVQVEGWRETLRSLSRLGTDFNRELRTRSRQVAEDERVRLVGAASRDPSKLAKAVGASIRTKSDRVPTIQAGGAKRVRVSGKSLRKSPKAGQVFYGAEFGGGKRPTTKQFRPHRGRRGYWLSPQLRKDEQRMLSAFAAVLDEMIEDYRG